VITNDVSDSYQYIYVIAHIICSQPIHFNVQRTNDALGDNTCYSICITFKCHTNESLI